MLKVVQAYRDSLARTGRETELGTDLAIGFHVHLAESKEKAIQEAAGYFEENLKMSGPLSLVRALTDEQIDVMSDPGRAPYADLPHLEGAIDAGAYLCGPPELIVEQLKRLEAEYPGLDRVVVSQPVGVPESVITDQLAWFARDVMPEFTGSRHAALSAD